MRVTMDIFSGRPNPSWQLTDDEADGCIDRVAAAPGAMAARSAEMASMGAATCNPLLTPMNLPFWDYTPIRLNYNCYYYAMNFASTTVAQPGRRAGQQYQALDCDAVRTAAIFDGCLEA